MTAAVVECVLGDWEFHWGDASLMPVFRPDSILPLQWRPDTPAPVGVHMADLIGDTVPYVALVSHWALAHPDHLRSILGGPFEFDYYPRTKAARP